MPNFEKHNYNYSEWTKERFSEVVTVSGPGRMIFLAGVGAEDENGTIGTVLYPGDFLGQCRYAFDKIKRTLARHRATVADIVKIVTDLCYRHQVSRRLLQMSYGGAWRCAATGAYIPQHKSTRSSWYVSRNRRDGHSQSRAGLVSHRHGKGAVSFQESNLMHFVGAVEQEATFRQEDLALTLTAKERPPGGSNPFQKLRHASR